MAEEQTTILELRDDFYRDSFGKIIFVIASFVFAILLLIGLSIYLHLTIPPPHTFAVSNEFRIQAEVPLNQPYRTVPDMLQWVSDSLRSVFVFDFIHYNDQLKNAAVYFTPDGYKVFLDQVNNYASSNTVVNNRTFVNGNPSGAPFLLNQGVLSGRYAWWVQIPFNLNFAGNRFYSQQLNMQVLVVRVSTLDNLNGLAIDNLIVAKTTSRLGIG